MSPRRFFEGWSLSFTALGSMMLLAVVIGLRGHLGGGPAFDEAALRILVRSSARLAVALFLAAFVASSLQRLLKRPWTAWLLRQRRYLGVGFAFVHLFHLGTLIVLGWNFADSRPRLLDPVGLAGGGLAYLFLVLLALTSLDGARRRIGPRRWTMLHKMGSWYIWIIFTQSYVPRALADPFYVPFGLALVLAPILRLAAMRKSSRVGL